MEIEVTRAQAVERFKTTKVAWDRLVNLGKLPGPRYLRDGKRLWNLAKVEEYIECNGLFIKYGGDSSTCLYRHFDRDGDLLYVGISFCAMRRLNDHKSSHWFSLICRVEIERFQTRLEALQAEEKAILLEKPKFNTRISNKYNGL